jgi:hypothetical protein
LTQRQVFIRFSLVLVVIVTLNITFGEHKASKGRLPRAVTVLFSSFFWDQSPDSLQRKFSLNLSG